MPCFKTLLTLPVALCLAAGAAAQPTDLSHLVPQAIQKKGYIEVVTDPSYGPPWSYHPGTDQTVYAGIDPDIAAGVSKRLGIEVRFVSLAFSGIIPAVRTGRYDIMMLGMFATEERAKVIDLINYVPDPTAILVQAGNPAGIQRATDLCGKTVSGVMGSFHLAMMEELSARCDAPIRIIPFSNKSDSFLQLETKRVDASLDGYIVSGYLTKNGVFASRGIEALFTGDFPGRPHAIGIAKENAALRDAIVAAINDMIQDGTYAEIFAKWGIQDLQIDRAEINQY